MKPQTKSIYVHKITLTQADEENMQKARALGYSIPQIIRAGADDILSHINPININKICKIPKQ